MYCLNSKLNFVFVFWYLVPSTVLLNRGELIFVLLVLLVPLSGCLITHIDRISQKKQQHVVDQWQDCLQCVLQCLVKSLDLNFRLISQKKSFFFFDKCLPFSQPYTVWLHVNAMKWDWADAEALSCAMSWIQIERRGEKECI